MEYTFTYELTEAQKTDVLSLVSKIEAPCMEQYPGWNELNGACGRICNFIARKDNGVVCYAAIMETGGVFRTAILQFGPLFLDSRDLVAGVGEIFAFYKKHGFCQLKLQLGQPINAVTELSEYLLQQQFEIGYSFDKNSNWTSIVLDLGQQEEDVLRGFSKGHKSSVKKALKENLQVAVADSIDDMRAFAKVYLKMNQARGLAIDAAATEAYLERIYAFLAATQLGNLLLVRDNTGTVVGGLITLCQGNTVRYFKGASDPDYRQLPILHLGIFEAIKHARTEGKKYFDFWGYNHLVKEDDQRFNINIFKKGFGGEFVFFPKQMTFELNHFKLRIYTTLSGLRRKLQSLKRPKVASK